MAKGKKITRKQLLKEPDEFMNLSAKFISLAFEYKKQIMVATCIVIGLVALGVILHFLSVRAETKAFALFDRSLKSFGAQLEQQGPAKALEAVENDFETLLTRYSGKNAAKLGRIVIANLYYNSDRTDEAITLLQKAQEDFRGQAFYQNLVLSGLAYAYEKKKNYDEAIKYFEMIANGSDPVLKDTAVFNLGLLYGLTGEGEKSQAAFNAIINDYADSIYYPLAKEKIAG
jgi:tetratricopeptide (TPR) repeat protein